MYILRCSDGSLYVGHTTDIAARLALHNAGRGATWTARRLPTRLVYSEPAADELEAIRRERQLKGWTRAKKKALVAGDRTTLRCLSQCTRRPAAVAQPGP